MEFYGNFRSAQKRRNQQRKFPLIRILAFIGICIWLWHQYHVAEPSIKTTAPSSNTDSAARPIQHEIFSLGKKQKQISIKISKAVWPLPDSIEDLVPPDIATFFSNILLQSHRKGNPLQVDLAWIDSIPRTVTGFQIIQPHSKKMYHPIEAKNKIVWIDSSGCAWQKYCWHRPLEGGRLIRPFFLIDSLHSIALPENLYLGGGEAPVHSIYDGKILSILPLADKKGVTIRIYHVENIFAEYSGLIPNKKLKAGDLVNAGEILGRLPLNSNAELILRFEIDGKFCDFEDQYLISHPLEKEFPHSKRRKS